MATLNLKHMFTEAFRRGRRPVVFRPELHSLEARLAPAAHVVADINTTPSTYGSYPQQFANFNGETYFSAYDAVHGQELWRTNGTEAGTILVKDVYPGSYASYPAYLTPVGGELYFVTADLVARRPGLWKSDGTTDGTVLVKSFSGDLYGQYPSYLTDVDGTLFFAMIGPEGTELWKSDGTEAGTVVVKDIAPGPDGSYPQSLVAFNDELYFTADDGTNGWELWKSDGTETGTVQVADIKPGPGGSAPRSVTVANGNSTSRPPMARPAGSCGRVTGPKRARRRSPTSTRRGMPARTPAI